VRGFPRSVAALITALGCVVTQGCVTVVQDPPTPVEHAPLAEPICHDWNVDTRLVSPEDLGFWGVKRSQLTEVVEKTFRGYGALPTEHSDKPAMTLLRLRLRLQEIREEPTYSWNLLSLISVGLWPYRTVYRLRLDGILFGPKTNVAAGTSEEARILTAVEEDVTLVSWSQLFFIFYPPAYTDAGRAEPFLEALQATASNVCTRLAVQIVALEGEEPDGPDPNEKRPDGPDPNEKRPDGPDPDSPADPPGGTR
jgi:hypothetical protein